MKYVWSASGCSWWLSPSSLPLATQSQVEEGGLLDHWARLGASAQLAHLPLLLLRDPSWHPSGNVRRSHPPRAPLCHSTCGSPLTVSHASWSHSAKPKDGSSGTPFNRHLHSCPSGPVLTHLGSGRMGKYVQGTHFWLKPGLSHAHQ